MLKFKSIAVAFTLALTCVGYAPTTVNAQRPMIGPSQLVPHWGFVRKGPCANLAGDACGTDPPVWHITPDQCGFMFSTSNADNEDGSASTQGVRFTLPTVAELIAAGYAPDGLDPMARTNRSGQCEVSFVMGAPGPGNYLRVGISGGVYAIDKFTPFAQGAYDIHNGEIVFPYLTPGVVTFAWNGTSWLARGAAPAIAERLGLGQMAAHGQGRLFYVTANPSWWTSDTLVGKLAYCPLNGLGTTANSNGGQQLTLLPINCAFRAPTAGTATEWIGYRNLVSGNTTAVSAGAAYGAGTAPNGVAYAAGNYIVLTVPSLSMISGATIEVTNLPMTLGTKTNGKWIAKVLDATHIELHQEIVDYGALGLISPIGAPSSFVAGDTLKTGLSLPATIVSWHSSILSNPTIGTARLTRGSSGIEYSTVATNRDTIVGIARRVSTLYADTATNRLVASWFNPVEKTCKSVTASDRTFGSTTFTEINSDIRCNFVFLNGASAQAISLGDTGRPVRYTVSLTVKNNTALSGCEIVTAFDQVVTVEPEIGRFMNGVAVEGEKTITVSGLKFGLTENNHYITAAIRVVGAAGTCTVLAASSSVNAYIWQ